MNAGDRFEFFDRSEAEETEQAEKKCDFPKCNNYKDGKIDEICENCDSRLTDSKSSKDEQKNKEESEEDIVIGFTEELLGKSLDSKEKSVIKDCLKSLEKLFNTVETSEKSSDKKKKK